MTNKVFVNAYLKGNLGDDLFVKILVEKYPDTMFYIYANQQYCGFLNSYDNVCVIDNNTLRVSILKSFKRLTQYLPKKIGTSITNRLLSLEYSFLNSLKITYFVNIGGSMFIQKYPFEKQNSAILFNKFILNDFSDMPVFFLGCNFGPYKTEKFKSEYTDVFRECKDVSFRDFYSYSLFKSDTLVRLNPDIVFSLDVSDFNSADKIDKSIGLSIRCRNEVNRSVFINENLELINFYLSLNYKLYLFSFCEFEGDESLILELLSALGENAKSIEVVNYSNNINYFLKMYFSMNYMVCYRFHSLIMSLLANHKILAVCYSNKMSNLLLDIGYEGEYLNLKDLGTKNLLSSSLSSFKYAFSIDPEILERADNHFTVLSKCLNA